MTWPSFKSRYTLFLEAELRRTQDDLRALTNSVLTGAGFPTMDYCHATKVEIAKGHSIPSIHRRKREALDRERLAQQENANEQHSN